MLSLNIWGNMLIEEMDNVTDCTYASFAQSVQMLYLISTYCVIFVYIIFLLTIKETLKRYYAFMERSQEEMENRLNLHTLRVSIWRGRSYQDWCDALAYSLYLINKGRIGSRAEREYIDAERASRQYRRLAGSILEYKYEDGDDDEEKSEISCVADDEKVQSTVVNKSKMQYGINSNDDEDGNDADESLLTTSQRASAAGELLIKNHGRSSLVSPSSSGSVSVTPRADGRNHFKYKCCSICLSDFENGTKVKVLPNCGHTFHGDCLEQWLAR